MWKDRANCRFLGGRLVYQKHHTCKVGKPHQWARVTRCVQGPILKKGGFNYKTGRGYTKKSSTTHHFQIHTTTSRTIIAGMTMGDCYRFRSYDNRRTYLGNSHGYLYAQGGSPQAWKVIEGKIGRKGTVSLQSPYKSGRPYLIRHQGYRAKLHAGSSTLWKRDASFWAHKGLVGHGVSFRSENYGQYFLKHDTFKSSKAGVWIRKYAHTSTFKKQATWIPIKVQCPK